MNQLQLSVRKTFKYAIVGFILGFLPVVAGCGASKESLHDLDHVVPAHWPKNMADAADKILERLKIIKSDPSQTLARKELRDLIDWVPEIAADTDMSEQQWLPIHALSETLGHHLSASDIDVANFEEDFSRLTQLLVAANTKLVNETTGEKSKSTQENSE